MKSYKYILFDWDGCLAKTLEVWLDAYKIALAEYGVYPADLEIANHFGDWDLPKYFGVKDYVECNAKAVGIAREQLKHVELYPEALELLKSLKGKKKLALLSSSSKDVLLNGVKHNRLEDYFEVILSGDDVTNHKPHPEVIQKALEQLAGSADEAIMIGDSRKDLGVAKNAGVDSVLVYPREHRIFYDLKALEALKPTYVVNSLVKIKSLLG